MSPSGCERQRRTPPAPGVEALISTERVLASVIEAVIGACYLTSATRPPRRPWCSAFAPEIDEALEHPEDFKSALQERLARRGEMVVYAVIEEDGPPHDRTFRVSATVDGERDRQRGRTQQEGRRAGSGPIALEAMEK